MERKKRKLESSYPRSWVTTATLPEKLLRWLGKQ